MGFLDKNPGGFIGVDANPSIYSASGIWSLKNVLDNISNKSWSGSLVTSGLVSFVDTKTTLSYPGSGTSWYGLYGTYGWSLNTTPTINGNGFNMNGLYATYQGSINGAMTISYWIKTTDTQSLFLNRVGYTDVFLGAYSSSNVYYNGSVTVSALYKNGTAISDLYNNVRTDTWMNITFVISSLSWASSLQFNNYTSYIFENGQIGSIMIYNRQLTQAEVQQNYEVQRLIYGV